MSGGVRRAAARRRVHEATAGRIRVGVAIVAGGAFGALVVLWGGLGSSPDGRAELPSANEVRCEAGARCGSATPAPTASVPTVPGANATPGSAGRPSGGPYRGRPAATTAGPTVSADGSGSTPTTTAEPGSPATGSPSAPASSPTSPSPGTPPPPAGPIDVIVDVPPILVPTCILHC